MSQTKAMLFLDKEFNRVFDVQDASVIYIENNEILSDFKDYLHGLAEIQHRDIKPFKNIKKSGVWYKDFDGDISAFYNIVSLIDYHKDIVYKAIDPIKREYFSIQLNRLEHIKNSIVCALDEIEKAEFIYRCYDSSQW